MTDTANFIADRALSLAYEAIQFPKSAKAAITWLGRARIWATKNGIWTLEQALNAHLMRIGTHYQELDATA